MTKLTKRSFLLSLIAIALSMFVLAGFTLFAPKTTNVYADVESRVFNFDTTAFSLRGMSANNDHTNAVFTVEEGILHMVNGESWRGGQEDGFFFNYTDANLSDEPVVIGNYNYFKIRMKRVNCGNAPLQFYLWSDQGGNFLCAPYLGAEFDGKWVDLVISLTDPVVYVTDLETGIEKTVNVPISNFRSPSPTGNLTKMRFNFNRGVNWDREAYAEYFGFFEDKETADAYNGNAQFKLNRADEYLRSNNHVTEFALAHATEEKLLEMVTYWIEENPNINVQAELLNYKGRYSFPTTTEKGFIYFDVRLYSAGKQAYIQNVYLEIEKEPNAPVLYKFDNEEIISKLQGMQADSYYYYNGVMKCVQPDYHQADGFWLYFDTTESGDGINGQFLMQSYSILQWRIKYKGQGPNQFFFNNYNNFFCFGIGYDEEVWLTVQFDTAKVRDAIKVLNESTGEVQYYNAPSPTYSLDYDPPAFRGLSNVFRYNMGRRSDLERWALVDYFGFFPTARSADEYGFDGKVGVPMADEKDKGVLYMTNETVIDKVTPFANTDVEFNDGIEISRKEGFDGDTAITSKDLIGEDKVDVTRFNDMVVGLKSAYSGDLLVTLTTDTGSYDYTLSFANQTKKVLSLPDDLGTLNSFTVKVKGGQTITLKYIAFFETESLANSFNYQQQSTISFNADNVVLTEQLAAYCYTEADAKSLALSEVQKVAGSPDANLKIKPDDAKFSIETVSFSSPTKNSKGEYVFKIKYTLGGEFGITEYSEELSFEIKEITIFEENWINSETGLTYGTRNKNTDFYFGGMTYAETQKPITNSDVKTVEFTVISNKVQTGYLVGNSEFSVESKNANNGELVIKVNGDVLLETEDLNLFLPDAIYNNKVYKATDINGNVIEQENYYNKAISIVFGADVSSLYVNGVHLYNFDGVTFSNNTSNFYVAGNPDSDTPYFNGFIKEVRVFNLERDRASIKRYVYETLHFNEDGLANGSVDGLINYWRMKEYSDGFVNRADYSNSLIVKSDIFYNGYYHEFVGEDRLESASAVNTTIKTIELWVMENRYDTDNSVVLKNGEFKLGINEDGIAFVTDGTNTVTADGNYNLKDCNYHHIAFTFGNSGITFYLDGVLVDTYSASINTTVSNIFVLGGELTRNEVANKNEMLNAFIGRVANFKVFSTVRTVQEINSDMTDLNKATASDGLVLNAPFDISNNLVFSETVSQNDFTIKTLNRYKIINEETEEYVTFVAIPDPQNYVVGSTDKGFSTKYGHWGNYDAWRFYNMNTTINNWIVDNMYKENIGVITTYGDLTQNATFTEFSMFEEQMSIFDGLIPYTLVLGNHDYESMLGYGSSTREKIPFDAVFKYEEWSQRSYYGGSFEEGTMDNSYYLFEFYGEKYMVVGLEMYPRDEVLEWVDYICKAYSDHKVIITTHNYLSQGVLSNGVCDYDLSRLPGGSASNGVDMFNKLVKNNSNIIQCMNGHVGNSSYVTLTNEYGEKVMNASFDTWSDTVNGEYATEGIIHLIRYYKDGRITIYQYDVVEQCYFATNYIWEEDMSESARGGN